MGHDIYARRTTDDAEHIAHLRRKMWEPQARVIYEVLGATAFNCQMSGSGEGRWFTAVELQVALRRLSARAELAEERRFLEEALAAGLLRVFIQFG